MRAIIAGARAFRRRPLAAAPLVAQSLVAAALVAFGALPATAAGASAPAVFPLGVYFDLKQLIAFSSGWTWLLAGLCVGVLVRSVVLAATLRLAAEAPRPFIALWRKAAVLCAIAALVLLPAAGMFYVAVATRYAPFAWIALVLGAVPSFFLARRAVRLEPDPSGQGGAGLTVSGWIAYAWVVVLAGAAMTAVDDAGRFAVAAVVAFSGLAHALFFLGWREHAAAGTATRAPAALVVTVLAVVSLFGTGVYDRYLRTPDGPAARGEGRLLLLGGVDSTSRTGALVDFRPDWLGYGGKATLLSYGGDGPYRAPDTHVAFDRVARIVADQIERAGRPAYLLGHSQSGLIVDRMIAAGTAVPERAVDFAAPPPVPPPVELPPPGVTGAGKPGGDFARVVSRILDAVGLAPFGVDVPAAPTKQDELIARGSLPRLEVWALGDSVWLTGDWRRPGATNLVALSDHVGITRDSRALEATRRWFLGRSVDDDESSWRGALVEIVSLAFAPWRPE